MDPVGRAGKNDIRIVRVETRKKCREGRRGKRCRRRAKRRIGKVVQTIPMPGVNGGIAMAPDGRTAYVSGTPESSTDYDQPPEGTPGIEGDVIHVFRYRRRTGKATRDGVIEVPAPGDTPPPQDFPPTRTDQVSWPRDLAISPDGKTLLAALNLAHSAAIIDTESRSVEYVKTGRYPYGAAITRDGEKGLISNEADGTVSVIDLAGASEEKEITVGPHLSHPEGMATDPKADRVYVAVTHQDLVQVINTKTMEVERALSVERPQGLGTAPVAVSVTSNGRRLIVSDSGEDAVAVFALPGAAAKSSRLERQADAVLQHEGRRNVDQAEIEREEAAEIYGEEAEERVEAEKAAKPVQRKPKDWELIGRVPTAAYPTWAGATPRKRTLVWVTAEGAGSGPNSLKPGETVPRDPGSSTGGSPESFWFKYLPSYTFGRSGVLPFPSDKRLRKLTPRASRQIRPSNAQKPPAGHAAQDARGGRQVQARLLHRAREPHLRPDLRRRHAWRRRPEARALRRGDHAQRARARGALPAARPRVRQLGGIDRRPLLDLGGRRLRLRREELARELRRPHAPVRLRHLLRHLAGRGLPVRPGAGAGHLVVQLRRGDRRRRPAEGRRPHARGDPEGGREVPQVRPRHDAGLPAPVPGGRRHRSGLLPQRRVVGRRRRGAVGGAGPDIEVYDSPLPQPGDGQTQEAPDATAQSRFECFKQKFEQQVAAERRAAVHLHHARQRPHVGHAPRPAHPQRDDRRERLGARRDGRG